MAQLPEGLYPSPLSILDKITRKYPLEMWNKLTAYLVIPNDLRSWSISTWLQGRNRRYGLDAEDELQTALNCIPIDLIWKWIDEDLENRAWYFAYSIVPKKLFREEGKTCLAREMLMRYGHLEPVRRNFSCSFNSGGWSGPDSLHWVEQKQMLEDFQKD